MNEEADDVRLTTRATDRAEALMELGRYEQAIPLLTRSLAESPDDSYLHCRLADAHFYLKDFSNAESFAQRALHLNPNSDYAHFRLAWVYMVLHHYSAALEHARAAISVDPDDEMNLYTLAWAEYHSGHYKQALAAAEGAIKLGPDNADLHELMADLQFNMDRKKEAEKHYREALKHNPESASIHCCLGECLAAQNKIYEASEHILNAVKIEPDNDHYRDTLFNIIHHDLLDLPLQSREKALSKLDPAVRHFYQDQLTRRGKFRTLRMASIATLWLLALSLLMLFFAWVTGEDIQKLAGFVLVVLFVYMALFIGKLFIKLTAFWHQKKRQVE